MEILPKRINTDNLVNSSYFKAVGQNEMLDKVEAILKKCSEYKVEQDLSEGESLELEILPFPSDHGFIRVVHVKGRRKFETARCFPKYEYVSLITDIKKRILPHLDLVPHKGKVWLKRREGSCK